MSEYESVLGLPTNTDGILNNDQGYFRNNTTNHITSYPALNLAVISNDSGDRTPDVEIMLNPINLSWKHFSILFFKPPSGAFYISPANANVGAVSFVNQTYETTYNKNVTFNISDQIKKAWSKKFSKPESAISPKVNIELDRQTFLTKNLGSIYGNFVGLSYDEAISSLLNDGSIVVGDSDDSASVKFLINYQYHFKPLDIVLLTTFTYITTIPCYKNTYPFSEDCGCPYSNDTKHHDRHDRSNLDLNSVDDATNFSDYESKNNSNNLEEYSVVSGEDNSNNSKMRTAIFSEITKFIENNSESVTTTSSW